MPKQGQSVESCIITEWYKKKGDTVAPGDPLFSYETDKASFQEDAAEAGVLLEILYKEGDEVPVLENVAIIGQAGEDISALLQPAQGSGPAKEPEVAAAPQPAAEAPRVVVSEPAQKEPAAAVGNKSGVSPRARNMAAREAVALDTVNGTGPNNRIIARDVEAALSQQPKMTGLARELVRSGEAQPVAAGQGLAGMVTSADVKVSNPLYGSDFEMKPLTNMRKLIAKAMHASLQNSAQLTHHLGADARNVLALRKEAKKRHDAGSGANITLNDMVCFAVIKALKKFPQVNAQFHGDSMKLFNKVHLGLAVDTERGLMVPAIKNADDLSIQGLSNQFREIAAQCRKGNVNPELLSSEAASFTVSNLGNYGVEVFTPVINLPQVAILGVNTIVPRPKELEEGVYGFVPYMGLSLTYDHRALDGGEATRFLKQIAVEIETLKIEW